jgi:hypothetical protein
MGDKRAVLCAPCAYNDEGLALANAKAERYRLVTLAQDIEIATLRAERAGL